MKPATPEGPLGAPSPMAFGGKPSAVNSPLSFCEKLGIRYPVICGAMYPCSNPELVVPFRRQAESA